MTDLARLKSTLNDTKLQKDNPPLFQFLSSLLTSQMETIQAIPSAQSQQINLYEIDTSVAVPNISLDQYVRGFTIIKDVAGNASGNNINLIGTVDGAANPSLTTDYEVIRLFRNSKTGEYHEW